MKKLAFLLTASLVSAQACSSDDDDEAPADDGADGADGSDGSDGSDGADGADGSDGADDGASEEEPVEITRFFDDFHASRYSQSEARAAELDAASEAAPGHGRLSFDRGLAHNWHLAESGRDPNPDPEALAAEAAGLLEMYQVAKENNPDDDRVDCFLGIQLVSVGRATKDDALVQQGLATLDRGVEAWPEFNLFCVGIVYDRLPANHPDYPKALDAAFETMDVCYGGPIDRENPDITPYLDQQTDEGVKRACWNDWIAPHNFEGFFLWMGDLLVKQGNVDAAMVAYNNITLVAEYPDWPYQSLLQDRLSSDLEAKAALYQDEDPSNDPPFAGNEVNRFCAACHAATADE